MRRKLFFIAAMLLMWSFAGHAQHTKPWPLYWVVETNVRQPNYSIVRFYDRDNTLIHEVRLYGVVIDIRVPKHKKKLDKLMELLKDYNVIAAANRKKNKPKSPV